MRALLGTLLLHHPLLFMNILHAPATTPVRLMLCRAQFGDFLQGLGLPWDSTTYDSQVRPTRCVANPMPLLQRQHRSS